MSNFNKEKFIQEKLKEYAGHIANISKGLYKGDLKDSKSSSV